MKISSRGKLIVIEGTDGSGKTTQTEILINRLKKEGIDAVSIRFPQYEKNLFGAFIRECLDGKHGDFIGAAPKIASVLYACDRFESKKKIENWLDDGKIVIADRYSSSNQIHQGGKIKNEQKRKQFLDWLGAMEYDTLGVMKPDAVLYLDMPYEVSMQLILDREGMDDADSNFEYLKNSKEAGMYMVSKSMFWHRINCMKKGKLLSIEDIHEIIWNKIEKII